MLSDGTEAGMRGWFVCPDAGIRGVYPVVVKGRERLAGLLNERRVIKFGCVLVVMMDKNLAT